MIRAEEVFEKWLEDHPHAADMCVLDIFLSAWKACEKDADERLPEEHIAGPLECPKGHDLVANVENEIYCPKCRPAETTKKDCAFSNCQHPDHRPIRTMR
jgi:hypothetical protein